MHQPANPITVDGTTEPVAVILNKRDWAILVTILMNSTDPMARQYTKIFGEAMVAGGKND